MKFPLASTVQIAGYVAKNQRSGKRYPLVLMLEPTLARNIACIGCGKIREYESNKAKLSVEEWVDAGVQCPAPDRKSTRLNSSHRTSSYAVFCLEKKQQ